MPPKVKTLDTKRGDQYKVDPRNIEVEEGFNIREDYGDLKALAASILERGVKMPLRCRRKGLEKDNTFIVIDGHRRLAASMLLIEQGHDLLVPVILEDKIYSNEERLLDMWTCNDGEPLKPVEKAELVQRLIALGWDEKQIAAKLGISKTYVINLERLSVAPKKLKKLVGENSVSATYAMEVLRTSKDPEAALERLENEITNGTFSGTAGGGGKGKKLTPSAGRKGSGKVNSVTEMKRFFKKTEQRDFKIKPEKREVYELLQKILKGELTQEKFFEMFVEEHLMLDTLK